MPPSRVLPFKLTGLLGVHLNLLVNELVVDRDAVVGNLVLVGKLSLELGGDGDVEDKGQRTVLLQVLGLLLIAGEGLAEHLDLVVADIGHQLVAQQAVHLIDLHGSAVLFLNHAHGHHTGTESGHLSLLAIVFQGLIDGFLIVFLLDGDSQQTIHLVGVLKRNIHCFFSPYYIIYANFGVQKYTK